MKLKLALFAVMMFGLTVLTGCEPLTVLDPKGPMAERLASDIMLTMLMMAGIVIAVFAMLLFMLVKYRASNQPADYEPPHIEGNPWVEGILVGIPIIIVAILSVVSVQSNYIVESAPTGYEDKEPLVVYASSSDWKWHFSYPEEGIETVNYLYVPTDRPLEFRLYSHGPITSFWIPQLGGQKYAMNAHVTTLHLAADVEGEYMGRNANFSGEGFAENKFDVTAMSQEEFDEWVDEVKDTADPLTEKKFEELLEPGHLGRMTFTGTHLEFSPAPEHHEKGDKYKDGHEDKKKHDNHSASKKESSEKEHMNHNE
ncbi:cytochrome aa3 quinol oxidase subunit II [Pseudalkalibacillus berkeleyi]|uniref:Quinol oxidase subunit 2 n=1 Tax=Pseudalkalibacillus berkeleyi TaxID=1069813 RepID=A0ABS9GY45_9BACL|nr:cytochrome aa3 quinol oxidase subunit II [Pseudalkalibacillus berkeleyi]MCF6136535.1 cytochrome aa3 quinol oxidase subunit II [Pseudalkalibacillus berkeleyi]